MPSAASGSISSKPTRSTPSEASAALTSALLPEVGERVAQQPADQELQAEIVDPLGPSGVG